MPATSPATTSASVPSSVSSTTCSPATHGEAAVQEVVEARPAARSRDLLLPGGRREGERGERRVDLGRLVDVLDREVLVGAVHRRAAGPEDHRRHLVAEAGGVAEPVLDAQSGGSSPRTSRTAVRMRRTTSSSGSARYPFFTSASTTSARNRGSACRGLRQAAVDLRADLLDRHARLRTAVDADHALVRDHRRTAGRQPAVDASGHDVGLGAEQLDDPRLQTRARTSTRRAPAPPGPPARSR